MSAEELQRYATALADAIEAALPVWVVRSVRIKMADWAGEVSEQVARASDEAATRAVAEVMPVLRQLLERDIDEQWTTPLALVRQAVRYPTAVLVAAGVPASERDEFSQRSFPNDPYDLSPAALADVDPDLNDAAIAWGAAKAFEHKRRHRGA